MLLILNRRVAAQSITFRIVLVSLPLFHQASICHRQKIHRLHQKCTIHEHMHILVFQKYLHKTSIREAKGIQSPKFTQLNQWQLMENQLNWGMCIKQATSWNKTSNIIFIISYCNCEDAPYRFEYIRLAHYLFSLAYELCILCAQTNAH